MAQISKFRFFIAVVATLLVSAASAYSAEEPRVIIRLYANHPEVSIRDSIPFGGAELALNYLGLISEPHHVADGVPDIAGRDDIRGVLVWVIQDDLAGSDKVADFVEDAVANGIPVIIMEDLPETNELAAGPASTYSLAQSSAYNRALGSIGVQSRGGFTGHNLGTRIVEQDPALTGFERNFDDVLPPVGHYVPRGEAHAGLVLERADGTRTTPIMITPKGAYVAPGYAIWTRRDSPQSRWYVNPFELFSRVFKTGNFPKADPTTLSGRRIYYSHVDGDGWLNVSQVEGYAASRSLSAEVVLKETVLAYPDLPVTIAPIAGDLDPNFLGNEQAQQIARAFFALAQVEPASHTYTHPFQWSYFSPRNYSPAHELQYRRNYPKAVLSSGYDAANSNAEIIELEESYLVPRAYGHLPFNLSREIEGAADYISQFAPQDKPVRLIQWSGDTAPFPEAIAAVKRAGLLNINGGDSRMDNEYPSYLTVAPFGFVDGGFRQIHTSGANENLYTDGWQTNFSGFRHVLKTLANTESPRRVSAANIYYHIYSGEREASLRAVKDTLDAVSRMELTPIATTTYVEMAEGFYSARFEKLSEFSWRVHDRGALSTLRFDDAENLNVDYTRSEGVLGARHVDDVLYVSLDRAHAAPLVALRRGAAAGTNLAILESARWEIWGLAQADESLSFNARGFGPGQMSWRTAPNQAWHVEARYSDETKSIDARSDADGLLHFVLPRGAETAIEINMAHVADGAP